MTKTKKSQYIKSALLVLSTLLAPLQFFSLFFNFLPGLYVYFVVPYLLWRIWFNRDDYTASKESYFWKIPIIFVITAGMFFAEVLLFSLFVFPSGASLSAIMITFAVSLLMFRCLSYAMMIFIWQPNILKTCKKWICFGLIILYFIALICLSHLFITMPKLNAFSFQRSDYIYFGR